jgi:hypothetical protein
MAFLIGLKTTAFGSEQNEKVLWMEWIRARTGWNQSKRIGTVIPEKINMLWKNTILFTNPAEFNTLPPVMFGACVSGLGGRDRWEDPRENDPQYRTARTHLPGATFQSLPRRA